MLEHDPTPIRPVNSGHRKADAMRRARDGQQRPAARRWNEAPANARSRRVVHTPTAKPAPSAPTKSVSRPSAPATDVPGASQPRAQEPTSRNGRDSASAQRLKKELAKPQASRISGRGGRVA